MKMRVAITGGTGFIGWHLAKRLVSDGHEVVLLARGNNGSAHGLDHEDLEFVSSDLSDELTLLRAFAGCDAVAHCAGINREIGNQTYRKVHIDGTRRWSWLRRKSE